MGKDQRTSASRTAQLAEECVTNANLAITHANRAAARADDAHVKLANVEKEVRADLRQEVHSLVNADRSMEARIVALERSTVRFMRMTFLERLRHALTGWLPGAQV